MTPGLTPSPSWHKTHISGDIADIATLWRTILLLASFASLLTTGAILGGIGNADLISSSITSDGALLSTTALQTGEATLTGRILACGKSHLNRDTDTGIYPASQLDARSAGPLLIQEYASGQSDQKERPLACVFGNTTSDADITEDRTSGILWQGTYTTIRTLFPRESLTHAEGRGLLDIRHYRSQNSTFRGRTFASGNLSLSEQVTRDQGYSP